MKSTVVIISILLASCSSKGGDSGTSCSTGATSVGTNNVVPIAVGCGYVNEPCVSVKICTPGTGQTTCQVIHNILLDTGSYGLRLFGSLVNISLTQETIGGHPVGECVAYLDNTADWGPVKMADVVLGTDVATNVPIQIIDNGSFAAMPGACNGTQETDPAVSGFNGILGVGLKTFDCETGCVGIANANNNQYFTCNGGVCTSTAIGTAQQVRNPVTKMTTDNNGIVFALNSVSTGGTCGAAGTMTLGISTAGNNIPTGTETVYQADASSNFLTDFPVGGTQYTAFIDSGSNLLDFPNINNGGAHMPMPICTGSAAGLYCPVTTNTFLTATQKDASGAPASGPIGFTIVNADAALSSGGANSYSDLGAPLGGLFDWGLPFFFGRTIYIQYENTGAGTPFGASTNGLWAWQ